MTKHKRLHLMAVFLGGLALVATARPVSAEEGGSGHYFPGSMASFMDSVSATPALVLRYNLLYYGGSVGPTVGLPIGGTTALGADATTWGSGFTVFWRPSVDMGKRWSYAMSATVPVISLQVSASVAVQLPGGASASRAKTDSLTGLGDTVVIPLMLNQNVSSNFNINYRLAFYAPTGSYEVGRLANTGKNFWTTEPTVALMYLGTKNGREASLFTGIDFNTTNAATDYKSGHQFHMDGTLAQHLPALGGLAGVGVTGMYYQQITGDSGTGATFGDFKSADDTIGPVVSYVRKIGSSDLLLELKWLHEFYTKNRLQGDVVFVKAMIKL
jgi:hypothetical protein